MRLVRRTLDHVAARFPGGTAGNRNLTASLGALLLVGILGEFATLVLGLQRTLPVHILLGVALIPIVTLKLASTGWRMIRYYTNDPTYRREGPPRPFLRGIAPLVVGSTVALFGSGVGLIVAGPNSHLFRAAHSASFVLFLLVLGAHVLAHLPNLHRFAFADWMRVRAQGHALRRGVVAFALVSGGAFAIAALQTLAPWTTLMDGHLGG
jgi:CO/xanthine dehydrogenase FAD-binding subunit